MLVHLDTAAFNLVHRLAGGAAADLIVAWYTLFAPLALVIVFLWWLLHRPSAEMRPLARAALVAGVIIIALAWGFDRLNHLYLFAWPRPRPHVGAGALPLLLEGNAGRFPYPEVALAWALTALVWSKNRRLGIGFLAASGLLALGRLYSGISFPSDMTAAIIVGAVAAVTAGLVSGVRVLRFRRRWQAIGAALTWGLMAMLLLGFARTGMRRQETSSLPRDLPVLKGYLPADERALAQALKSTRAPLIAIGVAAIPGFKVAEIEFSRRSQGYYGEVGCAGNRTEAAEMARLARVAFAADPRLDEVDVVIERLPTGEVEASAAFAREAMSGAAGKRERP
jgi:hypothetical protein